VGDPELLFLDEPTTGLDPQSRLQLWDVIEEFKKGGRTVVITTHYMDEAEQLCDRLVVMDGGRIAAEGSPAALVAKWSSREVVELRFEAGDNQSAGEGLVGLATRMEVLADRVLLYTDDGDDVVRAVHEAGWQPKNAFVRRSTLEDVFLRLTGRSLVD
jgi:lipooligosaccharide transport system ATP-binding protein